MNEATTRIDMGPIGPRHSSWLRVDSTTRTRKLFQMVVSAVRRSSVYILSYALDLVEACGASESHNSRITGGSTIFNVRQGLEGRAEARG